VEYNGKENSDDLCHLRSTHRRRAPTRAASAAGQILLEMQSGSSAQCESEIHLAARTRCLSQSALFRRTESSVSSALTHGSIDRRVAMVHQAASGTVGPDNANGSTALDARRDEAHRETGGPRLICNDRKATWPAREFCC